MSDVAAELLKASHAVAAGEIAALDGASPETLAAIADAKKSARHLIRSRHKLSELALSIALAQAKLAGGAAAGPTRRLAELPTCIHCGSKPGERCRRSNGSYTQGPHKVRRP